MSKVVAEKKNETKKDVISFVVIMAFFWILYCLVSIFLFKNPPEKAFVKATGSVAAGVILGIIGIKILKVFSKK